MFPPRARILFSQRAVSEVPPSLRARLVIGKFGRQCTAVSGCLPVVVISPNRLNPLQVLQKPKAGPIDLMLHLPTSTAFFFLTRLTLECLIDAPGTTIMAQDKIVISLGPFSGFRFILGHFCDGDLSKSVCEDWVSALCHRYTFGG